MQMLSLIVLCLFSFNSFSQQSNNSQNSFALTLKSYGLGNYQEALGYLNKINSSNKKIMAQKEYLSGVILNKMQLFEKSLPHFKKSLLLSHKAKDLYYEYAQALLANNDLETSRRAFTRSYKAGFQKGSSLYYMAYISQLLNQPKLARAYYRKVISLGTPQKALLQGSSFQIAETNLELGKKKKDTKRIVKKYVLPQLEKALKINPTGTIASDIQRRIFELQNKFDLDPLKMVNGRRVSSKKTTGYIDQKVSSDNNITSTDTSSSSSSATQASSKIFQTEAYINRRFIFAKRFIITPDIRWNFITHSDDETAAIWANNTYTINPTIRTLSEHTFFSKPASFILDYEYSYLSKALTEAGKRKKDSVTTTYNIGERFQYFSFGETTFKYSGKSTTSANSKTSDNTASIISIDQIASIAGKHLLIFLYQNTSTDYQNNTSESSTTNMFRVDYINTNIGASIQFQTGLSFSKLSYKEATSVAEKGSETTTSPMIKFSRSFTKHFKLSTDYTYTKVSSDGGKNYTKSVFSMALKYQF